jgi:hypothetical protein
MRDPVHVANVVFHAAPPTDVLAGLLGHVDAEIDGWNHRGLGVRRTRSNEIVITYPTRVDRWGNERTLVLPARPELRIAVQLALVAELVRQRVLP